MTNADVMTSADKVYQGAGGSVRIPFRRHRYRPNWKILTTLRRSPSRTIAMVQAILVLHHVENPTYQG